MFSILIFSMLRFLLICTSLLLVSCSKDIDLKQFENTSAEDIFAAGKKEIANKNYADAVLIFEELERLYPYSKLTAEAQILEGECNYNSKKYDEASSAIEIFVKTHPTHKKVPYALYMLGIIHFEQMPIIERDQDSTAKALAYFSELQQRYPGSEFVKKSEEKVKQLRQQMAGREMNIARYYQSRKNYAAAIGRLNVVVDNYTDTDHAPEALLRSVECYISMGIFDEAKLANRILETKFSETPWAKYSKELLIRNNIK
ncbi:MAG: outer membrane protein assembly factor BamD [Holosporales bacterium]|nr:outer membrane protein assembly factor BamD [Holosporales bacterium]